MPTPLRIFSWGYAGWGNATRQLVRAVDLVEAKRGFEPPVFVDVRLRRSVRAVGFRDGAFARLLGPRRYRWMRSLGNPMIENPRSSGRVKSPAAAGDLLDLAREAARQRRRVIFFCSCPSPDSSSNGCHRFEVRKHLLAAARRRGQRVVVEEWPGGRPARSPIPLRVGKSAIATIRSGRISVPLPADTPLQTVAGLPWGALVELRAGADRQLLCAGPAQFKRGRWVLDVFLPDTLDSPRDRLVRLASRERRLARLDQRQ